MRFTIVAIVALAFASPATAQERTNVDRCPAQPEVLKTASGAHARAQKGWDSDKIKKDKGTIERVRVQARCAPTQEGRKHVRGHIDKARGEYRQAKERQHLKKLYAKLTAVPGQAWLAATRMCESTNRYTIAPGGAYGMLEGWAASASAYAKSGWPEPSTSVPYTASPEQQDIRASLLYQMYGNGPWPNCP